MDLTKIYVDSGEAKTLARISDLLMHDPIEQEKYCRAARELATQVPSRIIDALSLFSRRTDPARVLVLSGIDTGEVPPTPATNIKHLGEKTRLARTQAILNEVIGELVAYEAEGTGRLHQEIVPNREAACLQTSLSSSVELEAHTEQSFSELRPHYVSLGCLRDRGSVATYVCTAREILRNLDSRDRQKMFEKSWMTGVDTSFRASGSESLDTGIRGPISLMQGSREDPLITLDQTLTRGQTDDASMLLEKVIHLYQHNRIRYELRRGDLLVLDNLRCMHGRSTFQAHYDGADRWLVRSFIVSDLDSHRLAMLPSSRTIGSRYS